MKLNKELYLIAAEEAAKVYQHADYQVGPRKTVEFSIVERELYDGTKINVLAIRGTDELRDWWKNFDMRSEGWWKKAVYDATECLMKQDVVRRTFNSEMPLLICGHSKSGPTVLRLMWDAGHTRRRSDLETFCVAFDPAKGLLNDRYVYLENTTIFRDPDSIVSYVGWSRFKHPGCTCITLPNDVAFSWLKPWTWVNQHSMGHFFEFVKGMEGDK